MERRNFLKTTAAGVAGISLLGIPFNTEAASQEIKLTILHTNDQHSRIDPFPDDGRQYGGMGGMARRATLISDIRKQEANVLLFDSGDIWQGTPYFNFFEGELEYKLMTQMRYDAATLGNHDFDNGLEGLQRQLPHAGFPFLSANYDFSNTILNGQFKPYKVFEKQGLRIGVFGLGIKLEGLVGKKNYAETLYLDPVQKAQEMVQVLREQEKCHLVVCLSHLGYSYVGEKIDDRKLAQRVSGIDLVLGGHTHTFMEEPEVIRHDSGHDTMINQVGWSGLFLGRIDLTFQKKTKRKVGVRTAVLGVDNPVLTS
ncbi:twin-arginine translocation signal domain-containing protein [Pontibacter qinzhouensis]|uniref:Twin-arginine translocation signal domain-containing protein n=1 Tax=Pontibacter qinzhouensis TaxID=2603253 RepID=A0A5C8K9U1_9BACT|nr:metallophosphatase [Pontibacter qinzhouensis]TXK51562.1 twin-arginine translocation signal domain-containing protein [Pontibacter qinzhouensis]